MNNEEVKTIMALPRKAGLISKYKRIYKIATGTEFTACLCGNGFNLLYTTCLNFSKDKNKLEKLTT